MLLYALGQEVAAKTMTSEQAREVYARRHDVKDTYLVQPEEMDVEKAAYWKDWQTHFSLREEQPSRPAAVEQMHEGILVGECLLK